MAWMIYLAKESDIGHGCRTCRFRRKDRCIADKRVDIHRDGKIDEYRPYKCPFRYWHTHYDQITDRFKLMTKEETKGWFRGADYIARHYTELEINRNRYVEDCMREAAKQKGDKHD